MARPALPERSRSARSSRQLSRSYHSINPDRVFGTHNRVLSFKPYLRLEWRGQNETEQPDHSASLGDSIASSTRIRFSVHTTRYAQAPRLAQGLKPHGNIDAVTENVVPVDDDVADIDADAKDDALVLRYIDISFGHAALNLDGTSHGVDHAGELNESAVPGILDDAP